MERLWRVVSFKARNSLKHGLRKIRSGRSERPDSKEPHRKVHVELKRTTSRRPSQGTFKVFVQPVHFTQ
jgi:hypothetical protein